MSTAWLTELIDAINVHTESGEGITRPSYSVLETKAMRTVGSLAIKHGLQVEWDYVGNLHIVKQGTFPEVVTGSHLDSVPNGGRYDGVAGVVAGLFAIINSNTPRQLHLIVFRGEESAWFGKCYLGSTALFGEHNWSTIALTHKDGESLGIKLCDLRAHGLAEARATPTHLFTPENTLRFLEVHIEQGPVLHEAGLPVGIVTGIRGNHRYACCAVRGEAGHSGTTPMHLRHDAVLGFAELMRELERALVQFPSLVMTCGMMNTDSSRHAMSVIPDLVQFALEYRSLSSDALSAFEKMEVREIASAIGRKRGLTIDLGLRMVTEPVALDGSLCEKLQIIASRHTAQLALPSGAGHDAAVFQQHGIPTGMIFVRNEHGSHNPRESMDVKDLLIATEVLRAAMCE